MLSYEVTLKTDSIIDDGLMIRVESQPGGVQLAVRIGDGNTTFMLLNRSVARAIAAAIADAANLQEGK